MSLPDGPRISPTALIDRARIGPYQRRVLAACLLLAIFDGFDVLTIGYLIPSISKDWGIGPGALTAAVTAGTIGLIVGAFTLGSMADRRGRRFVIMAGMALFSIATGLSAAASSVTTLGILRFAAGLGLGAVLPSLIALAVEFAPQRRRAMVAVLVSASVALGGALGGGLVNLIVPHWGWRSILLIGGLAPLLAVPIAYRLLPESPTVLLAKGRRAELSAILRRIDPERSENADLRTPAVQGSSRVPVRDLFTQQRALPTVFLWCGYFCGYLMYFVVSSWLPTLLTNSGMAVGTAVLATTIATLGNIVGCISLGLIVDRNRGEFWPLTIGYPLGAVVMVGLVFAVPDSGLVLVLSAALGLTALGNLAALNAASASVYPTSSRATGISYGLAVGRLGSVAGPTVVGILIAQHVPTQSIFIFGTVPAVLASMSVFGLWRCHRRARDTSAIRTGSEEAQQRL